MCVPLSQIDDARLPLSLLFRDLQTRALSVLLLLLLLSRGEYDSRVVRPHATCVILYREKAARVLMWGSLGDLFIYFILLGGKAEGFFVWVASHHQSARMMK